MDVVVDGSDVAREAQELVGRGDGFLGEERGIRVGIVFPKNPRQQLKRVGPRRRVVDER